MLKRLSHSVRLLAHIARYPYLVGYLSVPSCSRATRRSLGSSIWKNRSKCVCRSLGNEMRELPREFWGTERTSGFAGARPAVHSGIYTRYEDVCPFGNNSWLIRG
ncbi:hypothetical protein RSOLAG1IB_03362 [Rhizoctonia solani AG-1 IB]|uniref:Uncharacterized protein n=1 Tax=Thanatephorus cucumeris (strain AG1-IB / isolate 7/3/14) TaxID=1108050 RepID=A0A0B7FR96_THACB|nr:hypothetical protein RSOLAG1IB_03362 [Rhizoctonia solani AG-1 IB]